MDIDEISGSDVSDVSGVRSAGVGKSPHHSVYTLNSLKHVLLLKKLYNLIYFIIVTK